MKGIISLEGLEFYAYHGVHPEENKLGNKYKVDIHIVRQYPDTQIPDELAQTVDYERVYTIIQSIMQQRHKLLEHIASTIQLAIKAQFQDVETVSVKVSKLNPPVGGSCLQASFEISG